MVKKSEIIKFLNTINSAFFIIIKVGLLKYKKSKIKVNLKNEYFT